MSLSKILNPLLRTATTQEDPSRHDGKVVDWVVENQNKQIFLFYSTSVLVYHKQSQSCIKPHVIQ